MTLQEAFVIDVSKFSVLIKRAFIKSA